MDATATPGLPMVVTTFTKSDLAASSCPGNDLDGSTTDRRMVGRHVRRPKNLGLFKACPTMLVQELDFVFADFNGVVVLEQLLFDCFAIDIGTVGAVQIFNVNVSPGHLQHGMFATDGKVVDDDIVIGSATQGGAVFGQLHFLDDDAID
jgi:hypothetical protein